MDFNVGFLEGWDLVPDKIASDFNGDITGQRMNVGNSKKVLYLLEKPAGTAGDDLSLQFNQATAASGGSTKALTFSKWWYKKASATNTFGNSILWTAVTEATATADLDLGTPTDYAMDTVGAVILVELDQPDVTNGYGWVYAFNDGTDVGNALLVNTFYLMRDVYQGAIPVSKA